MKTYPSIPKFSNEFINRECIIYFKHDGSQIRLHFSKKLKWHQFGSRHQLIDPNDPILSPAIPLFLNKYAEKLETIIFQNFPKITEFTAFAELFGPNSFAGQHTNEPKDVILFDINLHKKGLIPPEQFAKLFKNLHIPEIIYQGPLTPEFVKKVREELLNEGVVAKGGTNHEIWFCKIKTYHYLNKLKEKFQENYQQYWE